MINLTDHILAQGERFDECLRRGVDIFHNDKRSPVLREARATWANIRNLYGLVGHPSLLTAPDDNLKLDKATRPSWGLTLQHYVTKLRKSITVNACPFAGDCTKVCVLDNGKGAMPKVQLVRRARTQLFADAPCSAGVLMGYDLARAITKDGPILFRPNVNSDLQWELLAPSLVNGTLFGNDVISYGYSKLPTTLDHDGGYLGSHYKVAYSWNENHAAVERIEWFMLGGGNVSVVTNRKPKTPIEQWSDLHPVVDADLTDEWMLDNTGVYGDLSAKGKARALIGKSGFVVSCYAG